MKLGKNYFEESKSSFLAIDKNLSIIIEKIMKNQTLLKMLYYTEKDCLKGEDLTSTQILSMLGDKIKIVPYLEITPECPIYILIMMDNFSPNNNNPEFRDHNIIFCILCHPDHWNLGNFQLRPYKIAGEIDAMFNEQKITGIGELNFSSGGNLVLSDQLMGLVLIYKTVQGIEDEINPLS